MAFVQSNLTIEAIQSADISVNGCFILGPDGQGPEAFTAVADFVRDSSLAEVQITLLTPFPGTPLYRQLESEGGPFPQPFWDCFNSDYYDFSFQSGAAGAHYRATFGFSAMADEHTVVDKKVTLSRTVTAEEASLFSENLNRLNEWKLKSRSDAIGPDVSTFTIQHGKQSNKFTLCLVKPDTAEARFAAWVGGPHALPGQAYLQCIKEARVKGYRTPTER